MDIIKMATAKYNKYLSKLEPELDDYTDKITAYSNKEDLTRDEVYSTFIINLVLNKSYSELAKMYNRCIKNEFSDEIIDRIKLAMSNVKNLYRKTQIILSQYDISYEDFRKFQQENKLAHESK